MSNTLKKTLIQILSIKKIFMQRFLINKELTCVTITPSTRCEVGQPLVPSLKLHYMYSCDTKVDYLLNIASKVLKL